MADVILVDTEGDNISLTGGAANTFSLTDTDAPNIVIDASVDARQIELRNTGVTVQWRYVGDASWTDLINVSGLSGTNGTNGVDGRNPLTVSATQPSNPQQGDLWYQP